MQAGLTRSIIAAVAGMCAATGPVGLAVADSTGWFDTGGGAIRLVIAPPAPGDETIKGMMEVRLAEGWKTYWRDPGASGIPPQIDVSASSGVSDVTIHYPTPVWIDNPYGDFAGYEAPVDLPITMTRNANGATRLVAAVFMGICEDICIPVQTRFEMTIDYAQGTTLDAMRVASAHAALPGEPDAGFELTPSPEAPAGMAYLTVDHSRIEDGSAPQLFVHAVDGTMFKPPVVDDTGDGTTRFVLEPARPLDEDRTIEAWVTVAAGGDSFETRYDLDVRAPDGG